MNHNEIAAPSLADFPGWLKDWQAVLVQHGDEPIGSSGVGHMPIACDWDQPQRSTGWSTTASSSN